MSRFAGVGEDVLVVPQLEGGTIWQLSFDGWKWVPVAEHDVISWLGYTRVDMPVYFPDRDEALMMNASPVYEGFRAPEATVLERIGGLFEPAGTVSLDEKLQGQDIWGIMVMDSVPMKDLLVLRMQVDIRGIGSRLMAHTFMRTDSGWIAGPEKELSRGFWWPLYSERREDGLHLWHMEMTSNYGETPQQFLLVESLLGREAWSELNRTSFEIPEFWSGTHENLRTIIAPDGSSMVVFGQPDSPSEVYPIVFNLIDGQWVYSGKLEETGLDLADVSIVLPGEGFALMRRGQIGSVYGEQPLQHYHLLRHLDGQWQLQGDLTSHRPLVGYYDYEIYYMLGEEWLTIFDVRPYPSSAKGARSYRLQDLSPRLVKWFRDSESVEPGIEYIPSFGYFAEDVSDDARGIWAWHWNLGWIFIAGRDSGEFWFHDAAFGWTWYGDSIYDLRIGNHWLYSGSHGDYVLCLPESHNPRYFFSNNLRIWMTDTPAAELSPEMFDEAIAMITAELAETDVTVEVHPEAPVVVFRYAGRYEGKNVTIGIEAPWMYTTGTGYACQARFEMDFSSLFITVDKETVYLSSYDLWTLEKILMPAVLEIRMVFFTPESGTMLTRVQFNDFTWDIPVFESFGP